MSNPFLCILVLFAYVIGTVNGIAYSLSSGQYVTAVCVAVLSVMAFPVAKNAFDELIK